MSIATESRARVILADFANSDAAGKINVLGTAYSMLIQPSPGAWAPFSVATIVDVPAKYAGEVFAFSLELLDLTTGKPFQVAQPGGLEPMRVSQAITVSQVQVPPGLKVPTDVMSQHALVMNFPQSLPFTPGSSYEWQIQIDGKSRPDWATRFHALGPQPGVVFGGPMNPPHIPGVPPGQ